MTYMQARRRDKDLKNRLFDSVGEGKGGTGYVNNTPMRPIMMWMTGM